MSERTRERAGTRPAFAFVFVTVLLDMIALGMVIPVLPKLVERFLDGDTARAAEMFGLFGAIWALMQFVCSPVQGALSDRFGRRPVILVSNFGLGFDYVLMAMAPTLPWLFVGRLLSGGAAASISTAYAYVADVTPPERRSSRFGLIGAAFGLGFVIGPAVGGLLAAGDPRLPFWTAAGFSLLNGLYGLFVLPESLPPHRRAPWRWSRASPLGALRLLRSRPGVAGLVGTNFLAHLAHVVLPTTFVLYASYRYGWGERDVGLAMALVGVCALAVQTGLVRGFVARFTDRGALLIGLLFGAAGYAAYGMAPTGALFCLGIPMMSLWGLASPTVNGLMSRQVGPSDQGLLQGANGSVQGLANIIGPGLFSSTFSLAIGTRDGFDLPGAPFLLAAAILVVSAGVAWRVTRLIVSAGGGSRAAAAAIDPR